VDTLRHAALIEAKPERVGRRGGKIRQAFVELKYESGGGKRAYGDIWVSAFQTPECASADEESGGHVLR
jgi:hypothetical protein